MARRRTRKTLKPSKIEAIEEAEAPLATLAQRELLEEITRFAQASTDTYVVTTPTKFSWLFDNGGWQTKPVDPGTELIFQGVRPAKNGDILFMFSAPDLDDVQRLEMRASQIFAVFPLLEGRLVEHLGFPAGNVAGVETFVAAAIQFIEEREARTAIITTLAKQEAEDKEREALNEYQADPMWGAF